PKLVAQVRALEPSHQRTRHVDRASATDGAEREVEDADIGIAYTREDRAVACLVTLEDVSVRLTSHAGIAMNRIHERIARCRPAVASNEPADYVAQRTWRPFRQSCAHDVDSLLSDARKQIDDPGGIGLSTPLQLLHEPIDGAGAESVHGMLQHG